MKTAVEVANKALSNEGVHKPDFIVQGEKNLLRYNDNNNREQLQHLFEIFDRKRERSEEHTSELQSRGLISYAVFCLKKKNKKIKKNKKKIKKMII